MAVILVTHNFGVVADVCDRVSVMRDGRVVESGPVRSIFYGAEHQYTRSLLADILEEEHARGPLVGTGHVRQGAAGRSRVADWIVVMTDLLLDARDVVVEYPSKGFRKPPFRHSRACRIDIRPGRRSAWSASPGRARPRSVGPCWAWPP